MFNWNQSLRFAESRRVGRFGRERSRGTTGEPTEAVS
jgi:hypothetical protein